MNFIDWIVIIVIVFAGLNGFSRGVLNSVVTFVGSLLVFVLAFYLKNPVSVFLYEQLPFFSLGGKFAGISTFNILIYEAISYVVTISILGIILKVITSVTGVVSAIVNSTFILGFPSKILGAIIGLLQGYILAFVVIFTLGLISATSSKVNESYLGDRMLAETPVLSGVVSDSYKSISEVYKVVVKHEASENKDAANLESLDILLKHEIITVKSAKKLVELDKISTPGASNIINKYDLN